MPAVDREQFQRALEESRGNVTHAARVIGVSRVHAMRLAAKFDLRGYARQLRGGKVTGRPAVRALSPSA